MKRTRLISFLLLLAIAPSGFSAPSGDAGSAEQNLEEILVTARSTLVSLGDQPIVDIPFTVLEVDQEQMQNLQAHTVLDVVKYQGSVTPVSSELVGNSQFLVRGFQSGFAPFIDGMPAQSGYTEPPVEFYENAQTLVGPAGFFFGFGSPGGLLTLQSKRPTETPYLESGVDYRSTSHFGWHVDASDSTDDGRFGARLNALISDGKLRQADTGERKIALGLNLDWRISELTKLELDSVYIERHLDHISGAFYADYDYGAPLKPVDPTKNYWGIGSTDDVNTTGTRLNLVQSFARDWKLTLSASYYDTQDSQQAVDTHVIDPEGDVLPAVYAYFNEDQVISAQGVIAGRLKTGPVSHVVNMGALYTRDRQLIGVDANGDQYGQYLLFPQTNLYNNYQNPDARSLGRFTSDDSVLLGTTTQESLFFSDTTSLGQWNLIFGGRYLKETAATVYQGDVRLSDAKFSPIGALLFKPSPLTSVYVSYGEGYEGGQQGYYGTINANERFAPRKSTQEEVGFKYEGARGTASVAAFNITRGGYKFTAFVGDDLLPTTFVSGEERHRGFDLDGNFKVTDWLRLIGGAQYLDARIQDVPSNQASSHPPGIPKDQAKLLAEFSLPAGTRPLIVSADINWYSGFTVGNFSGIEVPGSTVFGLGVRRELEWRPGKRLTARLNVDNLADKRYFQPKFNGYYVGEPRMIRASLVALF